MQTRQKSNQEHRTLADQAIADYNSSRMTHGANQYHHQLEEPEMLLEEAEYGQYQIGFAEEDEMVEGLLTTRSVHQCNVCNKIFVSFKGLQQHAVIHTNEKPFQCDICSKTFRFKSNLFEHRSVHTGYTPHACPYCGKTCRLKGNLKKHLRTHVTTKEELEAAWRPFASNRRPPADIPDDAIVVRGVGGSYYTPPPRPKKKKLGLGESEQWVSKLQTGELLPQATLDEKLHRLEDHIFNNDDLERLSSLFEIAKSMAFETHQCPTCKTPFMTRAECMEHYRNDHVGTRDALEFFCEKCFRPFADEASYQQHQSYHTRVNTMFENGSLHRHEPQTLLPTADEFAMMFDGTVQHLMEQHHHSQNN